MNIMLLLAMSNKIELYLPILDAYYQLIIDDETDNTITVSEIKQQRKIKGTVRVKLLEGREYPLYIWDNKNIYCGNTKVLQSMDNNNEIMSYILTKPTDFSRRERRQYVRVSFLSKIKYRIDHPDNRCFDQTAQGIDISGGGMRCIVAEQYGTDTKMVIQLPLTDKEVITRGKVVWEIPKKDSFWIGIDFLDIDDRTLDYIINYVFNKLRKQMQ